MKIYVKLNSLAADILPFERKKKPEPIKPKKISDLYMEAIYTFDPDEDNSRWLKMAQQAHRETTQALNGPNAVENEKEIIMKMLEIYKYHQRILKTKDEDEFNRLHDELEPIQNSVQAMFKKLKGK